MTIDKSPNSSRKRSESGARTPPAIVWFRDDLRITDNPALEYAAAQNRPIIPLFVFETALPEQTNPGGAQKWMLHHALSGLASSLGALGAPLVLRKGDPAKIIDELIDGHDVTAVYWNRRYTKHGIATDSAIKSSLKARNIEAKSFQGSLLHEPKKILTAAGGPFRVYTPFWRAFEREIDPREPLPAPRSLVAASAVSGLDLQKFELLPTKPDWAAGLRETWETGEAGAQARLEQFLKTGLVGYAEGRDFPSRPNVSRLSPDLRFGTISPWQVWHAVSRADAPAGDIQKFRKELVWREFSYHLLYHFPDIGWKNVNPSFDHFPWKRLYEAIGYWQRGKTGYPFVDAGMRELWHTGYMHNRVRMVVASFLVKHMLIDWRLGERWFWDTLIDADPANNSASWQWVAGSGADAAPYFRVFNPVIQGRKFDPDGEYVRRWVPELSRLPAKHIHDPWAAPADTLYEAGVELGRTYPKPLIRHEFARDRALAAFDTIRKDT